MKHTVYSPYDGAEIGKITLESWNQAEEKLLKARDVFKKRLSPHERISVLRNLAVLVEKEQDAFALSIAREGGKPLTDAKAEVTRAIDGIQLAVSELLHGNTGIEMPMGLTKATQGHVSWTTREPRGVVFAISAFNHPLNLLVHQVAPAIATGCPIILKPATATPLTAVRFVELVHEAGLPEGWCQLLLCENDVASKLAADPRIAFVSFIGSSKVGWMLRSKLAPGVGCALEHGGAAPVIVDETVDIAAIVKPIVKGGYYHSGQVCVSVQRIFVQENIQEMFTEALVAEVQKLKTGDPTKEDTDCGPLIRKDEVKRVHEWVEEAEKTGGKILIGGKPITGTTYEPTVILNPSEKAKVSREEIFGPVVAIYPYRTLEEAIMRANDLPGRMQSSIYTKNIESAMKAARELNATGIMINEATTFRADWMPFGGRGVAGLGMGGIGYTMHEYTEEKLIVMKVAL
ncbi:MAG: aldehyde dehydrogenase family protein [Rickettsiales bacterium]